MRLSRARSARLVVGVAAVLTAVAAGAVALSSAVALGSTASNVSSASHARSGHLGRAPGREPCPRRVHGAGSVQ